MNVPQQTHAIVLSRVDFGEADRIITMLSPEYGKLSLMAKGVRRIKSKLAGGVELFSVSEISFVRGRGDVGTLVSTRLIKHYSTIIVSLERVQLGYELIKLLNRATEDKPEAAYFRLLELSFAALDDQTIDAGLIRLWFFAQLLRQEGHTPNLLTDTAGKRLTAERTYGFDMDKMAFSPSEAGAFDAIHIKLLRLLFGDTQPQVLQHVKDIDLIVQDLLPLVESMLQTYVRT